VAARFEMTHRKGNPEVYSFYQPSAEAAFHKAFEACRNGGGDMHAMLTFDRRYFLQGLLNIDDKMCGRHSLESRPSFLHQDLVRHVLRIKPEALLNSAELKHFLRHIAGSHLPRSVTHRSDKMGFTTPIGVFVNLNAHRIREQIFDSRFRRFYNLTGIQFTAENKFSREVFGLLMLDLWLNRYVRGGGA
jgi:asparagine synthetase B (glutamine-hydrolysing)